MEDFQQRINSYKKKEKQLVEELNLERDRRLRTENKLEGMASKLSEMRAFQSTMQNVVNS